MKSEDAQVAAAAATNNAMKRIISFVFILVLILSLSACAPNNILTPDNPDTPDTQGDEQAPAPDNTDAPDTQGDEQAPVTSDKSGYITAKEKKNAELLPSIDISTLGIAPVKVSDLADKKLTVYTAERNAFTVGKKTDKEWIDSVCEQIGVDVKQYVRTDKTLYSSQAIAQKSGMSLDIVSTLITDIIPTRSLMKSALTLTENTETLPFSKRVFDLSGGKVFTGYGNAKMMWYNKDIVSDEKAYDLFEKESWNTEALALLNGEIKSAEKKMIECSNWASFASACGTQITGLADDGAVVCALDTEQSYLAFRTFSQLLNTVSTDKKTFKNGGTAFTFTDAPVIDKGALGFVPVPSYGPQGKNVAELCGVGMGVSKTATDEQSQYALTFILLWSARYSEARADALVFDYKLSEQKAEKYIEFSETNGGLYNADRVISSIFTKSTIPETLCGEPDEILTEYAAAFERTAVLNGRNQ